MESEIISYYDIVKSLDGRRIQKGMNFRINNKESILLMNLSKDARYSYKIEYDGIITYEGHDIRKIKNDPDPKKWINQK